ncbi:MAG TPA: hypothetical protein VNN19_05900 [bacterium]|nr:hypothetical protein [bacterium]
MRRTFLVLAAIAAAAVLWQVWLAVQAAPKIPPDLAGRAGPRGTVDLQVQLRFPPERFHILMLQRFGRVSGTDGRLVELRGVPLARVREIARFYWVERIAILDEEGG